MGKESRKPQRKSRNEGDSDAKSLDNPGGKRRRSLKVNLKEEGDLVGRMGGTTGKHSTPTLNLH